VVSSVCYTVASPSKALNILFMWLVLNREDDHTLVSIDVIHAWTQIILDVFIFTSRIRVAPFLLSWKDRSCSMQNFIDTW
jgi:hypothetical protein